MQNSITKLEIFEMWKYRSKKEKIDHIIRNPKYEVLPFKKKKKLAMYTYKTDVLVKKY